MEKKPLVLLVDDHRDTRSICGRALEQLGYGVMDCESAAEAAGLLRTVLPRAVIVDAGLDPRDVRVLCSQARTDARAVVVLLLPPRFPEERQQELEAFADLCFRKPFRVDDLVHGVAAAVERGDRVPENGQASHRTEEMTGAERLAAGLVPDGASPAEITDIGGCRIERVIGRGSTGIVCLGRHRLLDVPVAVKLIHVPKARWSSDEVQRFLRGARAAALIQHPHIVPVLNAGREAGFYYLIQRYIEGRTLRQVIDRDGPLPEAKVVRFMREVASGLAAVHAVGIVHRDVKPQNILYAAEGHTMLTDFGLARPTATAEISGESTLVGTPLYMSPEQCEGKPLDGRSDLYSLGVTAFEALTGRLPITGGTPLEVLRAHVEKAPHRVREIRQDVSEEMDALISRLLAKDPADRHPDARELVAALDRVQQGE